VADTEITCNRGRQKQLPFPRSFIPCAQKCPSIPDRNNRFFSSPKSPNRFWGPPSLLFQEYKECSFPGSKAAVCAVFHTRPSSVKVSNDRSCTSTLPHAFMKCRETILPPPPLFFTFPHINLQKSTLLPCTVHCSFHIPISHAGIVETMNSIHERPTTSIQCVSRKRAGRETGVRFHKLSKAICRFRTMNKEDSTSSELQIKKVASSVEIARVWMLKTQTETKKMWFSGRKSATGKDAGSMTIRHKPHHQVGNNNVREILDVSKAVDCRSVLVCDGVQ